MKKKTLLLAGTLSLESLLGCGSTEFPQYTGRYELRSVSYSDPAFVGEQQMPLTLSLVDSMEHLGSHWNHYLRLEFIPKTEDQANGALLLKLDDLARIDRGAWPNNWYNGAEVYQERIVYGTSAFCNYQYFYFLYLETVPPVEVLQNVYPGKGKYIGEDPVTKMPLNESLARPEEVEFDATKWYDAVEENEGITLYFTFVRHLRSKLPGWDDGYNDCILPSDNRDSESLTFTYHADSEYLNDEMDMRKGRREEIKADQPGIVFFKKVVSDVK